MPSPAFLSQGGEMNELLDQQEAELADFYEEFGAVAREEQEDEGDVWS